VSTWEIAIILRGSYGNQCMATLLQVSRDQICELFTTKFKFPLGLPRIFSCC